MSKSTDLGKIIRYVRALTPRNMACLYTKARFLKEIQDSLPDNPSPPRDPRIARKPTTGH